MTPKEWGQVVVGSLLTDQHAFAGRLVEEVEWAITKATAEAWADAREKAAQLCVDMSRTHAASTSPARLHPDAPMLALACAGEIRAMKLPGG